MGIDPQAKESVGALCANVRDKKKRLVQHMFGTCFFVSVFSCNGMVKTTYLVTARHVQNDLVRGSDPCVRLNRFMESGVECIPLTGQWYSHPDPAVDLTLTLFETDKNVLSLPLGYEKILNTPQAWINNGNPPWPPGEFEDLLYIASLYQHLPYDQNLPVVRHGKLALSTDVLIHGIYGPSKYYLMDSHVYPGNSGAPVWIVDWVKPGSHPEFRDLVPTVGQILMLGILSSAHPELQEVVKVTRKGKIETQEYYNLGIALVTPMEKLKDIIELKELIDMRESNAPKPPKPIPVSHPSTVPEERPAITKQEFERALKKVSRKLPPSESGQEKPGT